MKLALRQINSAFSPANSQQELYRNLARSHLGEHVVNLLKRINAFDWTVIVPLAIPSIACGAPSVQASEKKSRWPICRLVKVNDFRTTRSRRDAFNKRFHISPKAFRQRIIQSLG